LLPVWFNQLAQRRGLALRAISRGVTPDETLQAATLRGLTQDGILPSDPAPSKITEATVGSALRIVSIGVTDAPDFMKGDKLLQWNDVPAVSKDYGAARDDLLRKMESLLRGLDSEVKPVAP